MKRCAVLLHPLVGKEINADFVRDQIAIYVTLFGRRLFTYIFSYEFFALAIGDLTFIPTQDMFIGHRVLKSRNHQDICVIRYICEFVETINIKKDNNNNYVCIRKNSYF